MNFTKDQQRVIDTRNKNILVSAAAGSGKTAVLVERILRLILDKENLVDIDRLLVVTFTRAAALEMRDRIRKSLMELEDKEPDNERLLLQLNLIHASNITTIDSFCSRVIRENFDRIGLDPAFRIGDESEVAIMLEDAADEVLDEAHEEGSEEFLNLLSRCSVKQDDSDIKQQLIDLVRFSESRIDPEGWLRGLVAPYEAPDGDSEAFARFFAELADMEVSAILEEIKRAKKICESSGGPYKYLDMLNSDYEGLAVINKEDGYSGIREALFRMDFARLSSIRDPSVDTEKKELVKGIRKNYKERIAKLTDYFKDSFEITGMEKRCACPLIKELSRLALRLMECFKEKKQNKNILDYSDLEHYALEILKGEAGAEYREFFQEIMIDEYQDSNHVQEAILTSISKDNNYFCVGDVKQSIYGFRLAEPEIFLERCASYESGEENSVNINLSKNFRSRISVINAINKVFRQIMKAEVGGVQYTAEAELYPGADYEPDTADNRTEFILLEQDSEGEVDRLTLQAEAVSRKIRELHGVLTVSDKGVKRKAEYRDFAILLRTVSGGVNEAYKKILEEAGIPVYVESRSGYFQTEEVRTVIDFLSITDNPLQDIPLSAVLKSPIGGFTDEELSIIRLSDREGSFFEALKATACAETENSFITVALREKCSEFLHLLDEYRSLVPYTPIHELIRKIIRNTGYDLYAAAKGGFAKGNLELLIDKAKEYEENSYRGLFRFIRYIELLRTRDLDTGEAGIGEGEDAVRIMSIHKSKGLEFPVVFICNLERRFNLRDFSAEMVTEKDLGLGLDYTEPDTRIKRTVAIKRAISAKKRLMSLGEEIRVLYVAMTRAREKLIMTASHPKPEEALSSGDKGILGSISFLDLFLTAFRDEEVREAIDIIVEGFNGSVEKKVSDGISRKAVEDSYMAIEPSGVDCADIRDRMEAVTSWVYPHENSILIPSKVSVSELKMASMEDDEFELPLLGVEPVSEEALPLEDLEPTDIMEAKALESTAVLDKKRSGKHTVTGGAERGTLYHTVFEALPFGKIRNFKDMRAFLSDLVEKGRMSESDSKRIWAKDILSFLKTPLARRMELADKENKLFREQPFLISRPANELSEEYPSTENIMIQGIIDAFFEEEGEIVVLDYKTDRVSDKETLIRRYQTQLDYYAMAICQILNKPVKEKLIYSVSLGEVVEL